MAKFRWGPPNGNVTCRWGMKKLWFLINFLLCFGNDTIQGTVIVERQQKLVQDLLNGAIFNDLVWPLTQISRACHYLTLTTSEMVQEIKVPQRILHKLVVTVHRCLQGKAPQYLVKDAVSECTWTLSALQALRNALYKFKTYLLTYNGMIIGTYVLHISVISKGWVNE